MINKRRFIVIAGGTVDYIFSDLYSDERVIILNSTIKDTYRGILKLLRKIHISLKLSRYVNLPLKRIWGYTLKDVDWNNDVQYYIITFSTSLYPIDISYLNYLKKEYSVKFVSYMLDPWCSDYARMARYYIEQLGADYIFTFDPIDSKNHGFIYMDTLYSTTDDDVLCNILSDLYYIGVNKGRIDELISIYSYLNEKGVKMEYRITEVPLKKQVFRMSIKYNNRIPYAEVVKGIKRNNTILEVLHKQQSGATLRYYEAVCYNKKLLTNNKNVVNLPFYNPDYIHVFEKPEDIDWEWVKERIPVDYHYDGRFSPTHLIDKIIELEEEKERNELGKIEAD